MRDYSIQVKPFQFLAYDLIEVNIEPNKHGTATVIGLIAENKCNAYLASGGSDTIVTICGIGESGQEEIVFEGIIDALDIEYEADVYKMKLNLITSSVLMDMVEHTRTFQNPAFTYTNILDFYDYYPQYNYVMAEQDKAIENMIVQYKETDWAFLKRIASHFNTFIFPDPTSSNVRYHFGMPECRGKKTFNPYEYTLKKGLDEYTYKKENGVKGIVEADFIYIEVNDREIHRMFEVVEFSGRNLYIGRIQSRLHQGELLHTYTLKTKDAFKTVHYYNHKLTGASLEGVISDVTSDIVMVDLFTDHGNTLPSSARWLPYSTVYSTPDGTGWYAMPEINDRIRLYYPTDNDKEGYVINSVHLETSSGLRTNPDYKSIRNKYDKEVKFTPTTLTMTNHKGMTIRIDDDFGITVESDKEILVKAAENLTMISETDNIYALAQEQICLVRGETSLVMDDNIVSTGQEIVVQGVVGMDEN